MLYLLIYTSFFSTSKTNCTLPTPGVAWALSALKGIKKASLSVSILLVVELLVQLSLSPPEKLEQEEEWTHEGDCQRENERNDKYCI